jgi:hypothetical protein
VWQCLCLYVACLCEKNIACCSRVYATWACFCVFFLYFRHFPRFGIGYFMYIIVYGKKPSSCTRPLSGRHGVICNNFESSACSPCVLSVFLFRQCVAFCAHYLKVVSYATTLRAQPAALVFWLFSCSGNVSNMQIGPTPSHPTARCTLR